jgi:hypothetical protein
LRTFKRILALDGGGVRGAISIAFLRRIEEVLAEVDSHAPRALCNHFDLIGGTSTGAIIGTALALGLTAAEIEAVYRRLAPRVFRRRWRIVGVQHIFDARGLRAEIERVVGNRTLDSPDLRTKLAIVTKRMDTGSAWIVTNCENSRYWNDAPDGSHVGNRRFRLAALVRASAAAPYYFEPEAIAIAEGRPPGLFVDGGITPHNDPALAMLQVATVPGYGFGWPTGAEQLHIISVGTGSHRPRIDPTAAPGMMAASLALRALQSMISDAGAQVLTMMQMLGKTDTPWTINSEVGDLSGVLLPAEPLFTFQRYDVVLEQEWLGELGFRLDREEIERLRLLDEPGNIALAYRIGEAAARKMVKPEHFIG